MKGLSYLIEGELEKAEVVLAAKSITDAIQKMAETAAKMEAEDVMPLNDPIREHFGPDAAAAFAEAVAGKLRELTATLSATKNAISDEIARMQGELDGTPTNDLATMDDDALDASEGSDGENMPDLNLDAPAADEEPTEAPAAPAPRFDADQMGDADTKAAGRARKESVEIRKPMLEGFDPDRIIAGEYVRMIREGALPLVAATALTETYGLSLDTLIDIVTSQKK
jgi:hypothetical protein